MGIEQNITDLTGSANALGTVIGNLQTNIANQLAGATQGFNNTLSVSAVALPYEVTAITGGIGTGTGGTNGTYAGGVSGGPAGFRWHYTIANNILASYVIDNPGISATNTAPTLSLPSGGLTGATIPTATVGTIPVNRIFKAPDPTGTYNLLWINNAGALASYPVGGTQYSEYNKAGVDVAAQGFGSYVAVPTVSVNGRPFQPTHLQRGTLVAIQGLWLDVQNNQYDPNEIVVVPTSSTLLNIYRKGDKPNSNYYIRQQFKLYNAIGGSLQKGYVWRLGEQWECYRTGEFTFIDVRQLGNDVETDTAFQPYGGYTTDAGLQPTMPGGNFDGGSLLIGGSNHTGEYEYDGTLGPYSGFTAYALANGSPYNLATPVNWRGTKFEFFHRTVGFLWNYSVAGSVVSKIGLSGTPAFDSYKRHVWSSKGYQLDQTVTWHGDASGAPLRIRVAYSGMGLVFRRESGDTGTTNPFISDTGYFGPRYTPIILNTTGYSDQIAPTEATSARLSGPTGITFEFTDLSGGLRSFNSTGQLLFRDTSGRNKLYPDYANDDTPAINEVWTISNIQRISTTN